MEHERGGIDRLVSNHRLYRDVLPARRPRPTRWSARRSPRIETGYRIGRLLVLREVLGQAPAAVLGRDQDVLHRVRAARWPRSAPTCSGRAPTASRATTRTSLARVARNVVYAPAYTIMGGTTQILRTIIAERVLGLPRT